MRILITAALAGAALAACAGDPPSDGNPSICSGRTFDTCLEEHDCMSGVCQNFMGDGFQVCVQGCDANTPCPNDTTGAPAECNAMGICKPAMPNECVP
jgi:hypothetical protein